MQCKLKKQASDGRTSNGLCISKHALVVCQPELYISVRMNTAQWLLIICILASQIVSGLNPLMGETTIETNHKLPGISLAPAMGL